MKKISLALFAAGALALASCSNEEAINPGVAQNPDGTVSFTLEVPQASLSRAISDGLSATTLCYSVYEVGATATEFRFAKELPGQFDGASYQTSVDIPLVKGKDYIVTFFAKSPDAPYTFDLTDGNVTIDYTGAESNQDKFDAFYGKADQIKVGVTTPKTVQLFRPFAQVNVGAADWDEAKDAGLEVTKGGLKFSALVYNQLDMFTGAATGEQTNLEFTMAAFPDVTPTAPAVLKNLSGKDYYWMAMDYVLVSEDDTTVPTVTFTYDGFDGNDNAVIASVPVKRNYRTNILGNFFTENVNYVIEIVKDFETPDYVVSKDMQALLDVAKNGGEITLQDDIVFEKGAPALIVYPDKTVTINLAGHNIISETPGNDAIQVRGELTVNGNGKIMATGAGSNYAIWAVNDAKVTLNGGTYQGAGATIQANDNAKIVINGGYYSVAAPYYGTYFVLNLQDNKPCKITVYGGQFENQDPSDTKSEPGPDPTSFVAEGYMVLSTVKGENTIYTVTKQVSKSAAGNWSANTADEWDGLVDMLNNNLEGLTGSGEAGTGKTIEIGGDIDFGGATIEMASPQWSNTFWGTVEGNGNTLSNFTIVCDDPNGQVGLFGSSVAKIKNLHLKDVTILCPNGAHSVGAIAGYSYGSAVDCSVENVTIEVGNGSVWDLTECFCAGGMFGIFNQETMTNCTADGINITSPGHVGGLVGLLDDSYTKTFTNCSVKNATLAVTSLLVDNGGTAYNMANTVGALVGEANRTRSYNIPAVFTGCTTDNITYLVGPNAEYKLVKGAEGNAANTYTDSGNTYTYGPCDAYIGLRNE